MKFSRPLGLRRGGVWWSPILVMVFIFFFMAVAGGLILPWMEANEAKQYVATALQDALQQADEHVVHKALAAGASYIDPHLAAHAFKGDFASILASTDSGTGWSVQTVSVGADSGGNCNDVVYSFTPPASTPAGVAFQQTIYVKWGCTNQPGSIAIYGQNYPVHWPATWVGAQVPVTLNLFGVAQKTFVEKVGAVEAVALQSNK